MAYAIKAVLDLCPSLVRLIIAQNWSACMQGWNILGSKVWIGVGKEFHIRIFCELRKPNTKPDVREAAVPAYPNVPAGNEIDNGVALTYPSGVIGGLSNCLIVVFPLQRQGITRREIHHRNRTLLMPVPVCIGSAVAQGNGKIPRDRFGLE